MEQKMYNYRLQTPPTTYRPHRRPAAHRRKDIRFVLRLVLEGLAVMLALWAVLATAEALCIWAGCPAGVEALR